MALVFTSKSLAEGQDPGLGLNLLAKSLFPVIKFLALT